MIRHALAAALAITTGLLIAGPVRADAMSAFETFCLATDGRAPLFEAAGAGSKWLVPSDEVVGKLSPKDDQTSTVAFSSAPVPSDLVGRYDLVVLSTPLIQIPQGGVDLDMSFCMVLSTNDNSRLEDQLVEWIGAGILGPDGKVWLYSKKNGRIIEETGLYRKSPAVLRDAWRDRSIYMVILTSKPGPHGAGLVMASMRRPGT